MTGNGREAGQESLQPDWLGPVWLCCTSVGRQPASPSLGLHTHNTVHSCVSLPPRIARSEETMLNQVLPHFFLCWCLHRPCYYLLQMPLMPPRREGPRVLIANGPMGPWSSRAVSRPGPGDTTAQVLSEVSIVFYKGPEGGHMRSAEVWKWHEHVPQRVLCWKPDPHCSPVEMVEL